MTLATNLGFPRIGAHRELKRAVESFWNGKLTAAELQQHGAQLRTEHWQLQTAAGLDAVPCGDFSFYDHVLDMALTLGVKPQRFENIAEPGSLARQFAMARGSNTADGQNSVAALEMTKWFDTNYHYLVPELARDQTFHLADDRLAREFREARKLGVPVRPVVLGPLTFLLLSKPAEDFDLLLLQQPLAAAYAELLRSLAAAGADWVQIDEPVLATDLNPQQQAAMVAIYQSLAQSATGVRLLLTNYFGPLGDNLQTAVQLPVNGLHIDAVRGASEVEKVVEALPADWILSLGLVDGRNVWKNDLSQSLAIAESVASRIGGDRLWIAPSCSLLHVPVDLDLETELDYELRSWMSFAKQKLREVRLIAEGVRSGRAAIAAELAANDEVFQAKATSPRVHRPAVQDRARQVTEKDVCRASSFSIRRLVQQERLKLPLLPTTTIGSFPQTTEIRLARAELRAGRLNADQYEELMQAAIAETIRTQEQLGLDVLVHGEPERNDMVEYFGEHLLGVAVTRHGWVQSYGTRCVKPPVIYGDVERRDRMTVKWYEYAQSLTSTPVKGMLTGPVTILCWSFVRNDQTKAETCRQIALAIRDEVTDLQAAGCRIVQVDEPALREGLPLRQDSRADYLDWATECFKLATCGVSDATQIHTHMCYCEFNDIIESIAALDADVISIEASRSNMQLLDAFAQFKYPNDIGPGVYDIHSPQVPTVRVIEERIRQAAERVDAHNLWINPDCGLKTRRWEEVKPALAAVVSAARSLRESLV